MKTHSAIWIVGALLAAFLTGGCASTEGKQASAEPQEKREYVTGSLVPRKDRSSSPVQTLDPAAVQGAMKQGIPGTGKTPAGGS